MKAIAKACLQHLEAKVDRTQSSTCKVLDLQMAQRHRHKLQCQKQCRTEMCAVSLAGPPIP